MQLIVFDLDHTLLKANSSFCFGMYLYRHNYFSTWALLASLMDYARHKWLSLPMHMLHHNSYSRLFKGRAQHEISTHVGHFLTENLPSLLYEPVLQRLQAAQHEGHSILILSSSPDFLVKEIARRLTIPLWKGTVYQVCEEGNFIGVSHVMAGRDKADYVSELARQLSLPLSAVTAYSDSSIDLPLLNLVGQAVGVNPDKQLQRMCRQRGWEIVA